MLDLLLKLLLVHFIGDFVLQFTSWVEHKEKYKHKSKYLYVHVLAHLMLIIIVLQFKLDYYLTFIIIPITHLGIDAWKLHFSNHENKTKLFFIDQALHLLVIGMVTLYYYSSFEVMKLLFSSKMILFLSCFIFATFVSTIIMKVVMSKWPMPENNEKESLKDAGTYIGFLERIFIFILIVMNYPLGIGLLVTAKSVFRYNDLSKANDRKLTEYVLIGSLISFGLAMISGFGYKYLLNFI